MRLLAWGDTDVGRKRDHNEDSYLVDPVLGLFVVADGMGGHKAGDRASGMAVEIVRREVASNPGLQGKQPATQADDDPVSHALEAAALVAGRAIYDLAREDSNLSGMGTTLTVLLVRGGRAYLAHVGDSRAYLMRDNRVEQLTVDHSWIEEQVRAGFMSQQEAQASALKHIVTRSVGYEREVQIDLLTIPALMGDCFFLCSDGLSNYVDGDQLRSYFTRSYFCETPRLLVEAANNLGGDDNITAVVLYVANDVG